MPEASSSSHDYAELPIFQPAFVPSPVIKEGEESSPSSFVPLSAQVTNPHSFPLGTEAGHNSMPKADTDHLSLDILMPTQVASTQLERVACLMTEEENAQFWDSSLDEDCSKQDAVANDVSMSPAQEYHGLPFILIVHAT